MDIDPVFFKLRMRTRMASEEDVLLCVNRNQKLFGRSSTNGYAEAPAVRAMMLKTVETSSSILGRYRRNKLSYKIKIEKEMIVTCNSQVLYEVLEK